MADKASGIPEGGFRNPADFAAWLDSLDHARQLAFGPPLAARAALRALPRSGSLFGRVPFDEASQAVLAALRAAQLFHFAFGEPPERFHSVATDASIAARNAAEKASSVNSFASAALHAAASVAQILVANTSRELLASVNAAVFAAANGFRDQQTFWHTLSADADIMQNAGEGQIPRNVMLWLSEPPADWMLIYTDLENALSGASAGAEARRGWQVWLDWFDAKIHGTAPWKLSLRVSHEIEQNIALGAREPDFWNRSADAVNADIAGWLREAGWGSDKAGAAQSKIASAKAPRRKTGKAAAPVNAPAYDDISETMADGPGNQPLVESHGETPYVDFEIPQFGSSADLEPLPEAVYSTITSSNAGPIGPPDSQPPLVGSNGEALNANVEIRQPVHRADLEPLPDTVDGSVDHLGRANIAYALASRINEIWDQMNVGRAVDGDQLAAPGFVIHIDAPWGGGKSTFAEQIARILNPYIIKGPLPGWLRALPIGKDGTWPERFRRPWHIVRFNAWQHQHVTPPWWVFYETIRETVTRQKAEETNSQETALPAPAPEFAHRSGLVRWLDATTVRVQEYAWRLFSPSFWSALLPLVLTVVAIYLLVKSGVIQTVQKDGKFEIGIPSNATGFIATTAGVLLGGGAALWRLWSAFTQTLLPGTPDAAKNFSLGAGDPLKRMKKHFVSLMEKVHRPVLVIVDDLDRCEPAFVVELVRGMQTILASPRVVYLLLGDRDWIEQSFTEVHKAMKGIEVGPEHRFGGRFVEKAIQFSMVLPDVSEAGRQDYVRQLLTSGGRQVEPEPVTAPPSMLDSGAVPESQRKIVEDLKADAKAVLETDDYEKRERLAMDLADKFDRVQVDLPRQAFDQEMAQKLFFRAATDSTAERATSHMIEGMASILPANPRQIKRIINTLSLLGQVLRIKDPAKRPGSVDWQLLARWVVLMVEWPKSWFTLTRHPGLANVALAMAQGKAEEEIAAIEVRMKAQGFLPAAGTRPLAKLIASNQTVMRALDFLESEWVHKPIMAQEIEWLREVMPAASGQVLQPPQQEKPASSDPVAKPVA